jgi:hypothetical protein
MSDCGQKTILPEMYLPFYTSPLPSLQESSAPKVKQAKSRKQDSLLEKWLMVCRRLYHRLLAFLVQQSDVVLSSKSCLDH